jgi:hypothetical protein
MFRPSPRSFICALLAVAVLASPSVATAQSSTQQHKSAIEAAQEFLRASGFVSFMEARFPVIAESFKKAAENDPVPLYSTVDVRLLALKLMKQREADLMSNMAELYAARFTAEELKQASMFYGSDMGARFVNFNRELASQNGDPANFPGEIAKRFSAAERSQIMTFLTSAVGQKFLRYNPEIQKAARKIGIVWSRNIGLEITRECQGAASGGT